MTLLPTFALLVLLIPLHIYSDSYFSSKRGEIESIERNDKGFEIFFSLNLSSLPLSTPIPLFASSSQEESFNDPAAFVDYEPSPLSEDSLDEYVVQLLCKKNRSRGKGKKASAKDMQPYLSQSERNLPRRLLGTTQFTDQGISSDASKTWVGTSLSSDVFSSSLPKSSLSSPQKR